MSIKKQYSKKKTVCKVTFVVPESEAADAQKVHVVGSFNNWSTSSIPMTRSKDGDFSASVELKKGQEYQFRYLFDDHRWNNETEADKLADTPFDDAKNSVIII
jgi:1,4-alpha-glucan branching enzyme